MQALFAVHAESRRKLVMHLGMFDDLWSAASLVPSAREDGLDVFLVGNRNCPPFVRGMTSSIQAHGCIYVKLGETLDMLSVYNPSYSHDTRCVLLMSQGWGLSIKRM